MGGDLSIIVFVNHFILNWVETTEEVQVVCIGLFSSTLSIFHRPRPAMASKKPSPCLFSTYDHVMLTLLAFLVPASAIKLYGVTTVRDMSRLSADPRMPQVNDFIVSLPIAVVLVVLRCTIPKFFQSIGRVVLSPSKRTVPFRVDRFSTSLFKLIYFWGISTLGFLVMKDEKWFPTSLGGSGEATECVRVFNEPPSDPLKFYVLVQFAYQVHNLIFMGFIRPFYRGTLEFVTHDLVAMLLIASTYLVNYVPLAATIGFLNDACDSIQYIYRVVVDSDRRLLVVPVYLAFLSAWTYTRLYVFPADFIHKTLYNLARENPDVALGYLYPLNALLIALQAMQVHWFWLFLRKAPQIFFTTTTTTATKI